MGKITINMVAEQAGVSRGTVDRVLNDRPYVKEEIKQKVISTMRELGYRPPKKEQAEILGLLDAVDVYPRRKIGILLPCWSDFLSSGVMDGLHEAESYLSGVNCELLRIQAKTDLTAETMDHLGTLEKEGADAIAICAANHPEIAARLLSLKEKGIPSITFNTDILESGRLAFVGQDSYQSGVVAGNLMSKLIRPEDHLICVIANREFESVTHRYQGFCDRMASDGFDPDRFQVLETYNDFFTTFSKLKTALTDHPKTRAIYMSNHSITACGELLKGMSLNKKIRVISHDLTESTRFLLEARDIDFAISQDFYRQGYLPAFLLWNYLEKQELPLTEAPALKIYCSDNLP